LITLNAQVLLLDEVTVDLDVLVRSRLLDWLEEETRTRNVTVLYAVRPLLFASLTLQTHIFDGLDGWPTHVSHLCLGKTTTPKALAWPIEGETEDVPASVVAKMDDPHRRGSRLLELALHWLAVDRGVREKLEASGELRRRGPEDTRDAKAFFQQYECVPRRLHALTRSATASRQIGLRLLDASPTTPCRRSEPVRVRSTARRRNRVSRMPAIAPVSRPPMRKAASMTEISVAVVSMPVNAAQSLTTRPAPITSDPRLIVPATSGTCSSDESSSWLAAGVFGCTSAP